MLRTKYAKIRETDSGFSLRNYAKQLDIGSGRLSELFNGKRRVTENMCKKWVSSPFFSDEEKTIMSRELGYSFDQEQVGQNYSIQSPLGQDQTA